MELPCFCKGRFQCLMSIQWKVNRGIYFEKDKNKNAGRENEMNENNRQRRRSSYDDEYRQAFLLQKQKREAHVRRMRILFCCLAVIIVVIIGFAVATALRSNNKPDKPNTTSHPNPTSSDDSSADSQKESQNTPETSAPVDQSKELVAKADRLAASYDYDGAMELLKSSPDYASNQTLQKKVTEYQATKDTCVPYPIDQITHVFYHTLIKDPSRAFDSDSDAGGYNQVMTTIDEFNKITQSMYEKGFVLVHLDDIAKVNEQGMMVPQDIMLPPGKKAFVLSQDDVSYYHYMDGDGMASKLVVDENGEVKTEYVEADGSITVGDFDMVPLIDRFVEQHPDFSYRGAKGTIALTGYNGVLGYRTDGVYRDINDPNLDPDQIEFLNAHPDFNWDQEVAQATAVATAMKEDGWQFASHTWGHINVGERSLDTLMADTEKWLTYVSPIVGPCDKIIFAFGADITGVEDYTGHPKFDYLKSKGFNYYCNVDSSTYWVQLRDNYLRMGRRNLDGYRMYYNPELLSDLYDSAAVFDPSRPTPVPPMG